MPEAGEKRKHRLGLRHAQPGTFGDVAGSPADDRALIPGRVVAGREAEVERVDEAEGWQLARAAASAASPVPLSTALRNLPHAEPCEVTNAVRTRSKPSCQKQTEL